MNTLMGPSTPFWLYRSECKVRENNLLARARRFGITAKGCLNACTVKRTPIHPEEDHRHREQDYCLRHDQVRAQNVLQTGHNMPLSPVCLSVCRSAPRLNGCTPPGRGLNERMALHKEIDVSMCNGILRIWLGHLLICSSH